MSFVFDAPWVLSLTVLVGFGVWLTRKYWQTLPKPDRLALLLRGGAIAMLCVALAGPRFAQGAFDRFIYFLVDRSASVGLDSVEMLRVVQALAHPQEKTFYGVISFGAQPLIESNFSSHVALTEFQAEPDPAATNIESALRLALETFPQRGRREIVLFTDGQVTSGDLNAVLARARQEGVPIHVWPLPSPSSSEHEVWLENLHIPSEIAPHLLFPIRVQVGATASGDATLLLYRNDELVQNLSFAYEPGIQELRLTEKLESLGTYSYRVYLKAERDRLRENNELYGATTIPGGPQVLLIEGALPSESPTARLLRSTGFTFERKALERSLELSSYKAVILNNIPLERLTREHRRALKNFVADLGGGVLLIQGRQAVEGLEGQSPEDLADLEEFLPISYLAPENYQIPGLALVFVMDRSGSMGDPVGGVPKIEILKRAALRSLEVLDPEDWVGLMAFDTEYEWIIPLHPLSDRQQFIANIQRLTANGGTDLYFALKEAFSVLERTPARVRHILVFTDGHNNNKREREYAELFERLSKSSVRVSTLGIDRAPNEEFLQSVARAGRGRYQRVGEFTDLPAFSLREVRRIAQLRWIEGESLVQIPAGFPSLVHAESEPPPVQGYVLTHERQGAQTGLVIAPSGDPLLAFRRYGLGQVSVLNTDLDGEGAREWLGWEGLSKLFGAIMAKVYRQAPREGDIAVQVALNDRAVELVADIREGDQWSSGLDVSAHVTGPTARAEVSFSQVSPGRYRAQVEGLPSGLYTLRLEASRSGAVISEITKPFAVPYASEYRQVGLNSDLLSEITHATGGEFLERPVLPRPSGRIVHAAYTELWPVALLLALGLFLADLAARKLVTS